MNKIINFKTFLLVGFCFSACIWSCTNEDSDIGVNIQPPNSQINVVNDSTAGIKVFSVYQEDNLKISNGNMLLGSCNDPVFGKYSSSFFAEIAPQSNFFTSLENPILDSIVLYLDYIYNYGDSETEQTVEVFEINSSKPINKLNGLANTPKSITEYFNETHSLGSATFTPKEKDSIPIRIKLDESLGNRLLNADRENYKNWKDFQNKILRGFYCKVKDVSDKGSIISISYTKKTNLSLYFRKENSDTISQRYMYIFPENTSRCNVIVKDYLPSINEKIFKKNENPDVIDTVFYIQGGFGIEGKIIISDIQKIIKSESPTTLNKAFISLELADSSKYHTGKFQPLPALYAYMNDSIKILDYISVTQKGTIYEPIKRIGNRYNILITRQLFNQIKNTDDTNMEIYLRPALNAEMINRSVIRGYKNSNMQIKLHLIYVPIN